MGTAIIGIRETGDLEGRDAKRVFQLYRRFSNASTLLPPAVGFILDEECGPPAQKEELRILSQGRVFFLSRRMYENYLLSPPAIVAVANEVEGFRPGQPILPEEVERIIEAKRQNLDFYCRGIKGVPADWTQGIGPTNYLIDWLTESQARCALALSVV
jgi:hypothetical protein